MKMPNYSIHPKSTEMYERFSKAIEDFDLLKNIEKVVFLFSGGKDATFGLYFMYEYINEKMPDIDLWALMVTYPTHVYYEDNEKNDGFKNILNFWKNKRVSFKIFNPDKEDLKKDANNGCTICKSVRKGFIDRYLNSLRHKNNTAIITGYTLYDILAYLQEYSLLTNFSFKVDHCNKKTTGKVMNNLHKMKIKENLPNGFRIGRPLVVFKENEIRSFLHTFNIPYVDTPCVVAPTKHKRAYFQSLNVLSLINNTDYSGVLAFLDKNNIEFPNSFEDIEYDNYFTDC